MVDRRLTHLARHVATAAPGRGDEAPFSDDVETLVVGAGFSGLTVAAELLDRGRPLESMLVLDRLEGVGGTWRANQYPGCECDVPALAYLPMHRVPGYVPRARYASSEEIRSFIEAMVDVHPGLRARIHLSTNVTRAVWHDDSCTWTVTSTKKGAIFTVRARFLVWASGPLSTPLLGPHGAFRGTRIHTAEWPPGLDVHDRCVGVVGTGASAIQIIPELVAQRPKRLVVFQRSPGYITEKSDAPFAPPNPPFAPEWIALKRNEFNWFADQIFYRAFNDRELNRQWRDRILSQLANGIASPAMRLAMTPDYPVGCKRPLYASPGFFAALNNPVVELVPEAVAEETAGGVITDRGRHVGDLDVLIHATGFDVSPRGYLAGVELVGPGGRVLPTTTTASLETLYGIHVRGFANLMTMLGPQGFIYHASSTAIIDAQATHIATVVAAAQKLGVDRVEPDPVACAEFARECRLVGARTVYASTADSTWSCSSWYNEHGGSPVGYTGTFASYVSRLENDGLRELCLSKNAQSLPRHQERLDMPPHLRLPFPRARVLNTSSDA